MTEDDFDEFVRVRWGDLEPAARLVVLDPAAARDVTVEALTRLRAQWRSASTEGRPVERARQMVLAAALARATGRRGTGARVGTAPVPTEVAADRDATGAADDRDDLDDLVVRALVDHLRGLDPLDRAVLVGRELWDAGPEEVAHVLDRPAHDLLERSTRLDDGLARVHATALGADGGAPHAWALDRDVRAAVDVVLRDLGDPPDPADLVQRRARRVRRRTVVLAGAAAVALGGAGAVVALRRRPPTPVAAPLPGPSDRAWVLTTTWPTRGPLASDPQLRAFRSQRLKVRDRILWAGDASTRRLVVVLADALEQFPEQSGIRVWVGAKGTPLLDLDELSLPFGMTTSADTVALTVPDSPETRAARAILLLLAMPAVRAASYSLVSRPTPEGTVQRQWTDVTLEGGTAVLVVDSPSTLSMRVRLAATETRPVGAELSIARYDTIFGNGPLPTEVVEEFIADATGLPVSGLSTRERVDEFRGPALFEAPDPSGAPVDGRLTTLFTTTPDGAVLRTATYRDDRVGTMMLQLAQLVAVAAVDDPWITMVNELRPGEARFLVVHPPAASVQVVGVGAEPAPASARVPTRGRGATLVTLGEIEEYGEFRVVLRDRAGRVTYDAVPTPGTWLVDA